MSFTHQKNFLFFSFFLLYIDTLRMNMNHTTPPVVSKYQIHYNFLPFGAFFLPTRCLRGVRSTSGLAYGTNQLLLSTAGTCLLSAKLRMVSFLMSSILRHSD